MSFVCVCVCESSFHSLFPIFFIEYCFLQPESFPYRNSFPTALHREHKKAQIVRLNLSKPVLRAEQCLPDHCSLQLSEEHSLLSSANVKWRAKEKSRVRVECTDIAFLGIWRKKSVMHTKLCMSWRGQPV